MVDSNNIEKAALMLSSSEGENIANNICDILEKARCFIKKATYEKNDKHYGEYMLAVEYLEKMAELEENFN